MLNSAIYTPTSEVIMVTEGLGILQTYLKDIRQIHTNDEVPSPVDQVYIVYLIHAIMHGVPVIEM